MSTRTLGIALAIVGVILLVVSLTADAIGIGNEPGIGLIQIMGAVVGGLTAIGGVWLALIKPRQLKK
jgi:hypothetical protein